ncbi:unnamed protein product, partial [Tetraodon nigroviridis]
MDPGASELESSLPHSENPCLIVEDSQPDSVALEDDPESSYRAVLARRLSSLQPTSRSPVLELISSPPGSKHSQGGSQSESSQRNTLNDPNPESQQESQVFNLCRPLNKKCAPEDMESGADSTTHCVQAEDQNSDSRTSEGQKDKAVRSEVSSSSSLDSPVRPAQQVSVQVLLHSQCLQTSEQDGEILSSQQDLFEADKTGAAVDSTVCEPEQEGQPTPTPGQSLRLLHLSGQGTLAQESLSQSSVDFVASSQISFTNTPFIVPSSPTGPENEHGTDEPMDTSLPPEDQNVFVPTQSQEACSQLGQKPASESQRLDSCPFSMPLQLSVNAESCDTAQQNSQLVDEDSQATQIEQLEEPPGLHTSVSVAEQPNRTSIVPESQTSSSSQTSCAEGVKVPSEGAENSSPNVQEEDGKERGSAESQLRTPEPMEEDSVIVVTDSEQESEVLRRDAGSQVPTSSSQPPRGAQLVSANGHEPQLPSKKAQGVPGRMSQGEGAGPDAEGVKDKILSDSSGDISFHFTLPKEGDLIGPVTGATPPLINQLKQSVRHSTPIEISPFAEKSDAAGDVSADVVMAASAIVAGDSGENAAEKEGGKLSLRMKLVTPVEEVSSDRFSLQKPSLPEEDGAAVKESTVDTVVTSPSVFSRVRQVHRQKEEEDGAMAVRGELFASPQRGSQASSLGCNSLPNSQPEVLEQEVPQESQKDPPGPAEHSEDAQDLVRPPETAPVKADAMQRVSQQTFDQSTTSSPTNKSETESPSARRIAGPSHRRHVRTIKEVRTTITRIITDVYYEDGKEVERKVSEESEDPVVDCQVLDSDVSPCRTGSSSVTSGDLADISSLSSKASSLQHSSGGTSSSTGLTRPDFIRPSSRGAKSSSPRRGGGHPQRGHRVGSVVRGYSTPGSQASIPLSPRGRARRGRPPSRSGPSRGGGHSLPRGGPQLPSSSDDEIYTRMLPPQSPPDTELHGQSDSLRSEDEEEEEEEVGSPPGSSFVGLRVVAKWSSNGYFYSGRIMKDAGEGRFRLRFDDGYECEVAGKDILLCDPIPLETEVTALLEDEYFSIGVVRGHKTEGQELLYSVEKDGQRQWYNRKAVILSLEQGNKLREQHSLGPYEPSPPLAKASDISLDNLVEGKRRRRGATENTPTRSSSSSPRTPGPSGKRKLMGSEGSGTPAKRGRRGARAAQQRVGLCNTSGSGTDLPDRSADVVKTHGPLPQNASLFMGFAFMMTASSESDRLSNKLSSDEEEGEQLPFNLRRDDGDGGGGELFFFFTEYVQTGPYNKTYTESQLQAGGGFILPDFNEEQCKAAYQSLLIADQHCRTQKYLLCLASGVPCVSHLWVRDCCKDNKLLNYRNYLLPAGMGPDDAIVEWHPRCSPFKALRVLLVFEKPTELWAQLITMGGASSVRHVQPDASDIPASKFDVVVTDHACPPLVEKNMASQQVPLVSPEWLIQSVICGERLAFHSLPRYRHNYT